jgi:hypothetical protein
VTFRPPSEAWEPWVYRGAMMLIGAVNIFGVIHFDYVAAYGDWPAGTETKRLEYLFYGSLCHFSLLGIQLYGLVARNLARIKLKLTRNGVEVE